jgi:putative endonuclease
MKTYRQSLGSWGEQAAANYLCERGYTVLERNVRTHYGEIDLIAVQENVPPAVVAEDSGGDQVIVFVEVKTRTSTAFGLPEEAITRRKRAHLLSAVQAYMQAHAQLPHNWRVDVIAIQRRSDGGPPEIIHFENAIY